MFCRRCRELAVNFDGGIVPLSIVRGDDAAVAGSDTPGATKASTVEPFGEDQKQRQAIVNSELAIGYVIARSKLTAPWEETVVGVADQLFGAPSVFALWLALCVSGSTATSN